MKIILAFLQFIVKTILFCFVFGALAMAILQLNGHDSEDVISEIKEAFANFQTTSASTFEIEDQAAKDFIIPIPYETGTKYIDARQISNIESFEKKDLVFHLCLDEECETIEDFKSKRTSLFFVRSLLDEKGISCFYPLKKDLVNLFYVDAVVSFPAKEGTNYKYEIKMRNDFEINLPKDRTKDFKESRKNCEQTYFPN